MVAVAWEDPVRHFPLERWTSTSQELPYSPLAAIRAYENRQMPPVSSGGGAFDEPFGFPMLQTKIYSRKQL